MLCAALLLAVGTFPVRAYDCSGIANRLDEVRAELKANFPDGVFSNGNLPVSGDRMDWNISLYAIVSAKFGENWSGLASNAWGCAAFAKYVAVRLYGDCKNLDERIAGPADARESYDSLRMGDLLITEYPHWMIYLSHDETGVTVLDCNGSGDQRIDYSRKYDYTNDILTGDLTVWQSPRWNEINLLYGDRDKEKVVLSADELAAAEVALPRALSHDTPEDPAAAASPTGMVGLAKADLALFVVHRGETEVNPTVPTWIIGTALDVAALVWILVIVWRAKEKKQ